MKAGVLAAQGKDIVAVEEAEKILQRATIRDGHILYTAACVYSLASGSATKDTNQGAARAERYASQAIRLLEDTLARGFHDLSYQEHNRMIDDPALAPILKLPRARELVTHKA